MKNLACVSALVILALCVVAALLAGGVIGYDHEDRTFLPFAFYMLAKGIFGAVSILLLWKILQAVEKR